MFSSIFWAVALTSSLACVITTLGITVISRYEKWGIDNAVYFMSFAAGALVYVGAFHLLPAVERENKRFTLLSMAAGIIVAPIIVLSKGSMLKGVPLVQLYSGPAGRLQTC